MRYFGIDSRRVTYREYWRLARHPLEFAIAAVGKLLGIRLDFHVGIPQFVEVVKLAPQHLPDAARGALAEHAAEFEIEGFRFGFFYTVPMLGRTVAYGAVLWEPDRRCVASLVCAGSRKTPFAPQETHAALLSQTVDGTLPVTSGSSPKLLPASCARPEHHPQRSVRFLCQRHRTRLDELPRGGLRTLGPDDLERLLVELNDAEIAFHAERGVYVELDEAEFDRLAEGVSDMLFLADDDRP